jgi:pimeloyl-ACP methyl ester carboxylesterase
MSSRRISSTLRSKHNSERRVRGLAALALNCVAAVGLAGCSGADTRPDLHRLYRGSNLAVEQPPLIVIPGIMGSKLRDTRTGEVAWPGSTMNLVSSTFANLALDIDPRTLTPLPNPLEAFDITDTAAGRDFYNRIIETLEDYGEFERTVAGTPVKDAYERHLYVLPYDWRRDNVETARKLDELIEQIRRDYGRPDLKVDIVAHSMGGLVSRYYVRFGTEDVLDRDVRQVPMHGAAKVNRLILLGTPSLGSANTIRGFIEGEKIVRTVAPETLATMASAYQLLPHMMRKPLIGLDGRPLRRSDDPSSPELDVFDPTAWRVLEWSVYDPLVAARVVAASPDPATGQARLEALQAFFDRSLVRAGRFQRALALPQPENTTRLIVFGADCALTPARVLAEPEGDRIVARFEPGAIRNPRESREKYELLMLEPGDGRVTKPSLLGRQSLDPTLQGGGSFPIAFSFFLCEDHDQLTSNINFQDNLLNALLSRSGN